MRSQEDSYAGAWESAGFREDDHAVSARDVAFDEVLGGRVSLPAFDLVVGCWGWVGGGWGMGDGGWC